MEKIEHPEDVTAFGPCAENPEGEWHEFEALSEEKLGPKRWRCRFCHRGQGELRDELVNA